MLAKPKVEATSEQPSPAQVGSVSWEQRPEQIELRIRQLVEAEASWQCLEPFAWELLKLKTTAAAAAKVLELAYLHGTVEDLEGALVRLKTCGRAFYREVHPAVRAHIVAKLWKEGLYEGLAQIVFRERDEDYLQPVERLLVFYTNMRSKDVTGPFMYFRHYRRELMEAAEELGEYLGFPLSRLLMTAGRMAVDLGYDDDARRILEHIRPGDSEHDEALQILLQVSVEQNQAGRSHYMELLLAQNGDESRLGMLRKFLTSTRGLGGFRDRNRPALNELLKNPLEWFSSSPESWMGLSRLLVENRDLEPLLPNIYDTFRKNAVKFHDPVLDGSLWQGPLESSQTGARDHYYKGIALLHQYVNCGAANEYALWAGREKIYAAKKSSPYPIPYDWTELHRAAVAHVAKSHRILEQERRRMLHQLRVAAGQQEVGTSDIEDYLKSSEQPPIAVLEAVGQLCRQKKSPRLEFYTLLKKGQVSHLTNQDLDRGWKLAGIMDDHDLAWRIATVLHARQALSPQVRHAWDISGEKRRDYPLVTPAKEELSVCLQGYEAHAARLAHACLVVGPALPELLALLDRGATAVRQVTPSSDSIEARVERFLAGVPWLDAPKKKFLLSFDGVSGGVHIPSFMHVLPSNLWSILVAAISERMGINAWGWKLSRLQKQIVDLIPRLASRQDLRRHSGKVAKWLKDLSPQQRTAWQDLAQLSRSMSDEVAADVLASFVSRLATLMFPHHYLALTALQSMRVPIAVLWDLEVWLLSPDYSRFRKSRGLHNRVMVPNALQRLSTVVRFF